jgi:hypothetical protein
VIGFTYEKRCAVQLQQDKLTELLSLAKEVSRGYILLEANHRTRDKVEVTTGSGMRRTSVWIFFPGRRTGLTEYGNLVGIGTHSSRWHHLKTLKDFEDLDEPDATVATIQRNLAEMQTELDS